MSRASSRAGPATCLLLFLSIACSRGAGPPPRAVEADGDTGRHREEAARLVADGRLAEARERLERALGGPDRLPPNLRSELMRDLARIEIDLGSPSRAGELLEQARREAAASPEAGEAAEVEIALAHAARAVKNREAAERHLAGARAGIGVAAPPGTRGRLALLVGTLALDRNRPEEAASAAAEALAHFEAAAETGGQIDASTLLSAARGMYQARFAEAFSALDRCLRIAGGAGSEAGRIRCLNARAHLEYNLADYEAAVRDYTAVLSSGSPLPDRAQATARMNLALCRTHLGLYGEARLDIDRAIEAARNPGRTEFPEAVPRYYRGYLLSRLGDSAGALEDYRAALEGFRAIGDHYYESFVLVDIGEVLLSLGRTAEALREYERSLAIHTGAGNPRGIMLCEEGIARAHLAQGARAEAEGGLRRALALAGRIGDDHGWSRIACVLGDSLLRASAPVEAERLLLRARDTARRTGLAEERFRATLGLARVRRDEGDPDAARRLYLDALGVLDDLRGSLRSESQHLAFSESRDVAYREAIALVLASPGGSRPGAAAATFDIAERARTRALLDVMDRTRLAGAGATPERRRARLEAEAALSRAQARLLARSGDPAELRDAAAALERMELEEASGSPAAARPAPLTLDRVVGLPALRGKTLAVYWIRPEASCLWRIRDGRTDLYPLAPSEEIARAAGEYLDAINREPGWENPIGAWREPARHLARLLRLEEIAGGVQGGGLLVVPDGPLHGLPFEPLPVERPEGPASMVGDLTEVAYLPSASFLSARPVRARPPVSQWRLLALGDPENSGASVSEPARAAPPGLPLPALPAARAEVMRIARLFPPGRAVTRIGAAARPDALRGIDAARADILHIAAHALVPDEPPSLAGILLAPDAARSDGFVRLHEIASLDLGASLAVLSACRTGVGKRVAGEGLLGLARAFLIAGVPAVVPSRWDVSDRATAELMERFYARLLDGDPPARALAAAQRDLRRSSLPLYSHPYYWAPFFLFGLPG